MTLFMPQNLVDCTAEVLVSQIQCWCLETDFMAAICNEAGADLDYVAISETAVQRERYKKIESFGEQLR